jgi:hypothetical protein
MFRPAVKKALLSHAAEQSGPMTAFTGPCSSIRLIAAVASDESQRTDVTTYSNFLPDKTLADGSFTAAAASATAPIDARFPVDEALVGISTASRSTPSAHRADGASRSRACVTHANAYQERLVEQACQSRKSPKDLRRVQRAPHQQSRSRGGRDRDR